MDYATELRMKQILKSLQLPLLVFLFLLFFFSSSIAEENFVFDRAFYRNGTGIYIDTVASPVSVRGQALRFRWGYDQENVLVPYKFAYMPFWIEHDLPFAVDLCDGRINFKTTFPTTTYINWDYNIFSPNYRNEMIDEPCAMPFDATNCYIDRFESYELVFCDGGIKKDVCSHIVQVEDGTFIVITRSRPVALSDLASCPLEKNRRYNLYHYAEIPVGSEVVFDVSLELNLPTLDKATFVIPAPRWTSTAASDYNTGNAYDFNWTKVTWDGNIMPVGDDRIHNDVNQLFNDNNLLVYLRMNDVNSTGGLTNDTNQIVYAQFDATDEIDNWGLWDTNAAKFTGAATSGIKTSFDGTDLNKITIMMWAKSGLTTSTRYLVDNSPGATGYGLRTTSGGVEFFAYSAGNTGLTSSVSGMLDANRWHHVAVVHSTTANTIYLDGNVIATTPYGASSGIDDSINKMVIGGDYTGSGGGYYGSIDEFKFYNRALSAAEIQADYNSWMASNYFSPVKDAGEAVNWDEMDWNAFVDVNNNVTVDYRGCSAADCSIAGAWNGAFKSANTGNLQTSIYADNNRYFQYRLSFDTNKQQWNKVRSPAIADGDKGNFGHISNVWVSYSTISVGETCDCPASGNWEINDGSICTLSTTCSLSGGSLHVSNGSLTVTSTGVLSVPTGYKIIIEKAGRKLIVEKSGKIIINK